MQLFDFTLQNTENQNSPETRHHSVNVQFC